MRTRHWTAGIAGLLIAVSACGGSSGSTTAATTSPPTTTAVATTAPPTTEAATTTTATTSAPTGATTTADPPNGDAELIAAGEVLFQTTAGGTGCAVCHTPEATGNPDLASPDIRGADFAMIADALATRAQMTTLRLSDNEIKAVAAYLATLDPDA